MNKLELVISSEVSNIVKVENFIESLTGHFGLPDDLYGKISLSLIEAVNNAILSGNKQQADKKVKIVAELCDDKFMISVEDEGDGVEYCVYVYNVQPGVMINYATGENAAVNR